MGDTVIALGGINRCYEHGTSQLAGHIVEEDLMEKESELNADFHNAM